MTSKEIDILNGLLLGDRSLSVAMKLFPRHGLDVYRDQSLVMEGVVAARRE